ncbi:amino acid permease [Streptomyces fractus]|uniref:amino acid permease n=1 Tax=Streptomyces fractus TaxID=641806 RepID=UPI003CF9A1D9
MTPTDTQPKQPGETPELQHTLKQRHLSMIALGGVIGAGLFVGSGAGIAASGPAIVLLFAGAGFMVMLIMRMLGEMSAARPASGSFSVQAERELGPWSGFMSGWTYWIMLCVGVASEAVAAGAYAENLIGLLPAQAWMALFMAFFCFTNLAAVKNFGELEFWFAALKVGAIVAFLILGVLGICGVIGDAPGMDNLTGHGGFFPTGMSGLAAGVLTAVFAYGGLETVTIAAAESDDPVGNVARAVRTAVWRIAIFYVGSMAVVVTLVPWDSPALATDGPYVAVLDELGIPAAGKIMQAVVLVALLSAMNANIYGASRMSHSLALRGEGPAFLRKIVKGVPMSAVMASCAFGFFAVVLNMVSPDKVFTWLMNTTSVAILIVWTLTCVTQLRMRRRLEREAPELLVVKMWGFPYLTYLVLVAIAGIFVVLASTPDGRDQLLVSAVIFGALAISGVVRVRRRRRAAH